jgi:hypothetical protein
MKDTKSYYRLALVAFARMSGWIVGPVLLALFAAKWVNFFAAIAVAFVVSILGLFLEAKKWKQ